MLARNVTLDQLRRAAEEVGVRLYGGGYGIDAVERQTRKYGPEYRFTLRTGERTQRVPGLGGRLRHAPKYQRVSQIERTSYAERTYGERYRAVVPGAVCWH